MLNVLAAVVFTVNLVTGGNYMFLRIKPTTGSLLDYLGPYPWYILSLEGVSFYRFCDTMGDILRNQNIIPT